MRMIDGKIQTNGNEGKMKYKIIFSAERRLFISNAFIIFLLLYVYPGRKWMIVEGLSVEWVIWVSGTTSTMALQ